MPHFVPEGAPEPPQEEGSRGKTTTLYAAAAATAAAAAGVFVCRYRSRGTTPAKSDAKEEVPLHARPAFALVLLATVVVHKSTTDCLANWTRQQTTYSGLTAALLDEFIKFPLVVIGLTVSNGFAMVRPTFRLVSRYVYPDLELGQILS